jgi:hypothetical protein
MRFMKKLTTALVASTLLCGVALPASAANMQATSVSSSCKKVGKATKESNGLPVCLEFFTSGAAIHLPADSAEMQYGRLSMEMSGDSIDNPTYFLTTRDGKKHELGDVSALLPKVPAAYWQQTIVALDMRFKMYGVIPQLFIPKSTMVAGFAGKSFVGTIESLSAPKGVNKMSSIRIDMDKIVVGSALKGHVVNYTRSIIESNTDMCKAKVLTDDATARWVKASLGSAGKLSIQWFPSMHMAEDSELSPSFVGGVNYMAPLPTVEMLLGKTLDTKSEFTFSLHGNPFAGVSKITGNFVKMIPFKNC